jgi:acyl dehydratase
VIFERLNDLLNAPPADLGETEWSPVEVASVKAFVQSTGSGQRDETVPPLMLLSITNLFMPELLAVPAASNGVNYGADSVRFGPPVKPGVRLRAAGRLVKAEQVGDGVQTTVEITLEAEGQKEPVCIVQSLSRWMR